MTARLMCLAKRWEGILLLFILIAVVAGSLLSPFFLNAENILTQTRSAIVIGFLALGLAVVVITGDIDLSGESVLAISAVALGLLYEAGVNIWLAGLVVILLGCLIGTLNGVLVAVFRLPALVVTLASMIAFRGLAFVVLERRPIAGFPETFVALGNGTVGGTRIPQLLVAFCLAALALAVLLHMTPWGRGLFAIGSNRRAAELSGIPVVWTRITAFIFSGAMAGCAAVMLAARFDSVRADAADGAILSVLTVVLLGGVAIDGGIGNLGSVLLSLGLIGLLQNGMSLANVASEVQQLIVGCLLIVAVVIPKLLAWLEARQAAGHYRDAGLTHAKNVPS